MKKIMDAITISPSEFRNNQKKYFDMAEHTRVFVKRGRKLIELVLATVSVLIHPLQAIPGSTIREISPNCPAVSRNTKQAKPEKELFMIQASHYGTI